MKSSFGSDEDLEKDVAKQSIETVSYSDEAATMHNKEDLLMKKSQRRKVRKQNKTATIPGSENPGFSVSNSDNVEEIQINTATGHETAELLSDPVISPSANLSSSNSAEKSSSNQSVNNTGFPPFFHGLVTLGKYIPAGDDVVLKNEFSLIESPSLVTPLLFKEPDKFPSRGKRDKPKRKSFFNSAAGELLFNLGLSRVSEWHHRDSIRIKNLQVKEEGKSQRLEEELRTHQNRYAQAKIANKPFSLPSMFCKMCNFVTESAAVLEDHNLVLHTTEGGGYRCSFCSHASLNPRDTLSHMEDVHNKKGRLDPPLPFYECSNCTFESKSLGRLNNHTNKCQIRFKNSTNQVPPKGYEFPAVTAMPVPVASLRISKESIMRQEARRGIQRKTSYSPVGPPPPKLQGPDVTQSNRIQSKSQHQRKTSHAPVGPPPPKLQGPDATPSNRIQSKSQHQRKKLVVCEICGGCLKDPEQLSTHMELMHKVKIHPSLLVSRPPLNCEKCDRLFYTDQGLERHLLGVHGFVTSHLKELANKNQDGGWCVLCGRGYTCGVVAHMEQVHKLSLKPANLLYRCVICTAEFNLYVLYENHVRTMHGESLKRPLESNDTPPKSKISKLSN